MALGDWIQTSATGGAWATATNWFNNNVPNAQGAFATFAIDLGIATAGTRTIDLGSVTRTVGFLYIGGDATRDWNLAFGTLVLRSSGGDAFVNDFSTTASANGNRISANVQLQSGADFLIDPAALLKITGTISESGGARSLDKFGTGTLVLAADNSFTGAVTVNAGTLQVGDGGTTGSLGSGAVSLAAGTTLALNWGDTQFETLANNLSGSGTLDLNGNTQRSLTGANAGFSGNININGGNLNANTTGALGSGAVALSNGTALHLSADFVNSSFSNTITGNGFGVTFSGSGGATISLGGVSGANTWGGNTIINAGATLLLSVDNILSSNADTTVNGTLHIGNHHQTLRNLSGSGTIDAGFGIVPTLTLNSTFDTVFSGNMGPSAFFTLDKQGAGKLTLTGSVNAFLHVLDGSLQIGDGGTSGSIATYGVQLDAGSSLIFNRSDAVTIANQFFGEGNLVVAGTNASALTLSGSNNTFDGEVIVNSGKLLLGSTNALGTSGLLTVDNSAGLGVLDLNGFHAGTFTRISGIGEITNTGLTASIAYDVATTATLAASLAGNLDFYKSGAGTLTVTGANNHTGETFINGSTLALSGFGYIDDSTIVLDSGGTLSIGGITNPSTNIKDILTSNTGFVRTGGKTLNITAANLVNDVTFIGTANKTDIVYFKSADTTLDLTTTKFSAWTAGTDLIYIEGTNGNDTLTGTRYADILSGSTNFNGLGNDVLNGGLGNDRLLGGDGNDTLNGGTGNDTLLGGASLFGNDVFDGGAGIDTVSYEDNINGVVVVLSFAGAQNTQTAGSDTFTSIENVTGSQSNDTLDGNTFANVLKGITGNDRISGFGGNDTIEGGSGADTLDGGTGTDTLSYANSTSGVTVNLLTNTVSGGDAASDILIIDTFENIQGSGHVDTLTGNNRSNVLIGGNGGDVLSGGVGSDTTSFIDATAGVIMSLDGSLAASGFAAGDTLTSIENLTGSDFNDTLRGSSIRNVLQGGNGADTLEGMNGHDDLTGGLGIDTLTGGLGKDKFIYTTTSQGGDVITDFTNSLTNDDSFGFLSSAFGGLAVGDLDSFRFESNTTGAASTIDVRFIYESDTGILRYDSNGSNAGGVTVIAFITGAPVLAADIDII